MKKLIRLAPLGGLLLLLPLAAPQIALADDEPDDEESVVLGDEGDKKERKLDTESPEAVALKELLHIDPKYGKADKQVALMYGFMEAVELEDFTVKGKVDRIEAYTGLEIGVGSRGQGLILHNLALKDDFEIELHARIDWLAPSSVLVFCFADGKSGSIFGGSFAKRGGSGYRPVNKGDQPDKGRFTAARAVKVKFVCKDGKITSWCDGVKTAETSKLGKKLDGRFGFYLQNIRVVFSSLQIKGAVDTSKL